MIFAGLIDWKDYYKHFLIAKHYHVGSIDDFLKDYADERIELKESGIYNDNTLKCFQVVSMRNINKWGKGGNRIVLVISLVTLIEGR